jgi:hypothetical protein
MTMSHLRAITFLVEEVLSLVEQLLAAGIVKVFLRSLLMADASCAVTARDETDLPGKFCWRRKL